jgi:hypothetical protein
MDVLKFTYALVFTEFEKELANDHFNDFDFMRLQDYAVHCLYCNNTNSIMFLNSNFKTEIENTIYNFINAIQSIGIKILIEQKILCINKEHNEYNKADVIKYFT